MLGGDEVLRYFYAHGVDSVSKLLLKWSDSYWREIEPSCRNWATKISNCKVLYHFLWGCSMLWALLISWLEMSYVSSGAEALPTCNSGVALS